MEMMTLTLADPRDAAYVRSGMPLVLDNGWRPVTWRDRLRWRLRELLRMNVRFVCTEANVKTGTISFQAQRWSWLRWRWIPR